MPTPNAHRALVMGAILCVVTLPPGLLYSGYIWYAALAFSAANFVFAAWQDSHSYAAEAKAARQTRSTDPA